MLKEILLQKKCIKIICGASNSSLDEIKKLVFVYSQAGVDLFDIKADELTYIAVKELLSTTKSNSSICISTGTTGDKHLKQAVINTSKCVKCMKCLKSCPQNSIKIEDKKVIVKPNCVGCGKCLKTCKHKAITMNDININDEWIYNSDTECIEIHADTRKFKEIKELLNKKILSFKGILSINLSRNNFSNEKIKKIIQHICENRAENSTIIQTDGKPISGGENDYASTLQSVAIAQTIKDFSLPVFVIMAGGTNEKTAELAVKCGVEPDGIAFGSYARQIIRDYIDNTDFWNNEDVQNQAISVAKEFVGKVREFLGKNQ